MVLDFVYNKDTSWDEVNKMTHFQEGLYSWMPAGAVAINERIPGVRLVSKLDYKEFSEKGEDYLIELWKNAPGWFAQQKRMASPDFSRERNDAAYLLTHNIFECREISRSEIEKLLNEKIFVIALVNADSLNDRDGSNAHFVLLYGQDEDNFILHDPGLPPIQAKHVDKNKFIDAFWQSVILVPSKKS